MTEMGLLHFYSIDRDVIPDPLESSSYNEESCETDMFAEVCVRASSVNSADSFSKHVMNTVQHLIANVKSKHSSTTKGPVVMIDDVAALGIGMCSRTSNSDGVQVVQDLHNLLSTSQVK
jgi:hypothetical protein